MKTVCTIRKTLLYCVGSTTKIRVLLVLMFWKKLFYQNWNMTQLKNVFLSVKPLSVNVAWQWKRFKTKDYKNYEALMLQMLPSDLRIPNWVPLRVEMVRGFGSMASDITNPTKPLLDILCKKYWFDDKYIFETSEIKRVVGKWNEFISIDISTLPIEKVQWRKK